MSNPDLIYLAVPYSGSAYIRHLRFLEANKAAGMLIMNGYHVFSPISHTHPIKEVCDLDGDFKYWQAYDERMILLCSFVAVLPLQGWLQSVGVQAEIKFALENEKLVKYIDTYNYKLYDEPFRK